MNYFIQDQDGTLQQVRRGDWRPDPQGPTYPAQSFDDVVFRAEHGLLTERIGGVRPDARYYSATEQRDVIGDEVVVTYVATPYAIDVLKKAKKDEAAHKRYYVEVGGVFVDGNTIPTDRESQAKWVAVRMLAKEDATYSVTWKTPDGWVSLDAGQIIAVADTVRAHVQNAFEWEGAHSDLIDALSTAQSIIDYEVI